ncbi:hypothetical protein OHA70_17820 [Kribbella sp. NBC_00382]|uniref:hypothetical protein n=1 Tax=Kribbella sp. NBC_00382 TaxID=2975967 RepID=UPI002E1B5CBE
MSDQNERRSAAEALTAVRVHQERTRRRARLPWWVYAAVFAVTAAGSALNDLVDLTGAKLTAVLVLVGLAVVFATSRADVSLLGRLRGVEPQRSISPWAFGLVAFTGGVGAWLISRYGGDVTLDLANAIGLGRYPNTAAGIVYGIAFTALFGLGHLLTAASRRRADL